MWVVWFHYQYTNNTNWLNLWPIVLIPQFTLSVKQKLFLFKQDVYRLFYEGRLKLKNKDKFNKPRGMNASKWVKTPGAF